MLASCGHITQEKRSAEVNAAMIEFLRGLPGWLASARGDPVDRHLACTAQGTIGPSTGLEPKDLLHLQSCSACRAWKAAPSNRKLTLI
jgi:hypothetical protein